MDADTFACIIHGMEDKGISDVVVTRFSSAHGYGFHYAMDDSVYSSNFIQLQPTWGEAAVVCLQTIILHLKHMGRIRKSIHYRGS